MTLDPKKLKEKIKPMTLAKAMKIPPTTIYSWKDKIPAWRIHEVVKVCQKLNINISDCEVQ